MKEFLRRIPKKMLFLAPLPGGFVLIAGIMLTIWLTRNRQPSRIAPPSP